MRTARLILHCLLLATVVAGALLYSAATHAQEKTLLHQQEKRRYLVYTPSSYASHPDKKYPLVLNFHGGGMTMREQMFYTQMNKTADAHDFIVVYPQGLGGVGKQDWNVGFGTSYQDGSDDVGFTDRLLSQLEQDLRVDSQKIYATGLSRGGFFCQRLAAEMSHRIAAIASVAASLPLPVLQQQAARAEQRPIGVMLAMGTADQVVAYEGKADGYLSALATYRYWIQANRSASNTTAQETKQIFDANPGDGTRITQQETVLDQSAVSLLTIEQGGHTWTGADSFNFGLPLGKTSHDVDLNALMWSFFRKHRRF
jgi:polyhydroxybutyrate depolymerase